MNNCPFCRIAESPDALLHVGEHSVAFLDINPIRPGHVLIVPKQHESEFFNLPEYILLEIIYLAKQIAKAQQVVYKPIKVGLLVAGFDISHAHLHLILMQDYHDITSKQILTKKVTPASQKDLKQSERQLKAALQRNN
jgi:histidine triad (HIT) family protein